ncbi:MAG: hypothetical protein FJ117_10640 [Deltaproteobacteria bacterium]|nr:hypothetical protein [Deltaproteobacteria bacterium]
MKEGVKEVLPCAPERFPLPSGPGPDYHPEIKVGKEIPSLDKMLESGIKKMIFSFTIMLFQKPSF